MNSFVIHNIRVVTPHYVLENGFVYIKKGIIEVIEPTSHQRLHRSCNAIDGQGKWLFPGIVDVFNTTLENDTVLEENLPFSMETVFYALDNKLVSNGITTVYHAFTPGTGNPAFPLAKGSGPNELILSQLRNGSSIRHNIYDPQNMNKKPGMKILEFPQSAGAAADGARQGISVLVGATDILRYFLNGEARHVFESVMSGSANMLCSVGMPASMINAVFLLHNTYNMDMAEAFRKVSINPAFALGINKRLGSIECGKLADLVIVRETNGKPFVEKVFINGLKVFEKTTQLDKLNRHMRVT